jgi:hypothetical protein
VFNIKGSFTPFLLLYIYIKICYNSIKILKEYIMTIRIGRPPLTWREVMQENQEGIVEHLMPAVEAIRFDIDGALVDSITGEHINQCNNIKFEYGVGNIVFRGEKHIMCAAGIFNFNIFSESLGTTWQPRRGRDRWWSERTGATYSFDYEEYRITFKKSDYGRTKLYTQKGSNRLTLYVASTSNFLEDEKCNFMTNEDFLPAIQYGVHKFNYNACLHCENKCEHQIINPEPIINVGLPEDLFKV